MYLETQNFTPYTKQMLKCAFQSFPNTRFLRIAGTNKYTRLSSFIAPSSGKQHSTLKTPPLRKESLYSHNKQNASYPQNDLKLVKTRNSHTIHVSLGESTRHLFTWSSPFFSNSNRNNSLSDLSRERAPKNTKLPV